MDVPIPNKIRNIRRASEIVSVFVKFGFGDFVYATGLDRLFARWQRLFSWHSPSEEIVRLPFPARFRRVLEELGPTFIKFGQILSTRPDLLPSDWIDEFCKLQDDCPSFPFSVVEETLQKSFGNTTDSIFRSIDPTPLASASIGQTHHAVLADGTRVILKIMRPNLKKLIHSDVDVLDSLARWIEAYYPNLGFSPVDFVQEFARGIEQEIDYTVEAQSTERLRLLFVETPCVKFPHVYWHACSSEVLTTEELLGTPLSKTDIAALAPETRKQIVKTGCDAVFRQCFEYGFFHADPHPGNMFVYENGNIGFIDCGMTGHIDRKTSDLLASIFYGVVANDPDVVTHAIVDLAEIDASVSLKREFHADIAAYISKFEFLTLGRMQLGRLLYEFFDKLRKYQIRCPSDIVFLIKAIATIEGVASTIDPEFNVAQHARPYIEKLVRQKYSRKSLQKRLRNSLFAYAEMLERLPDNAERIARMLNRNKMQFRLTHEGLESIDRTIHKSSRRVSVMMLSSSLVLASSVLVLAECISPHNNYLLFTGIIAFVSAITIGTAAFLFGK